jgi:SnoaL-like domain
MPLSVKQQRAGRRYVLPLLACTGIVIGLVAVSRATDPQDAQKAPAGARTSRGDVEIHNLLKAVTTAYNQADAKALAAVFTDDAVLFDQDGKEVRGRDAIGRH